ncbi:MAG: TetR/AcrR family transcriptional regulator [Planctomycetia bacterium]|nr:TetR/AcrR family transcriptional regulator [Planctomycetia bacterium]
MPRSRKLTPSDSNATRQSTAPTASRRVSTRRASSSTSRARSQRLRDQTVSLRERLILAAIDEVEEVGFDRFSVRRVAASCGASCAAPYKHFRNKREFFEAILDHITEVWLARQAQVLKRCAALPLRDQLVELGVEYIRFMVDNPRYRAILMLKDETFDVGYLRVKSKISDLSKEMIWQYCQENGVEPRVAKVKMYIVRSLIYGASLMFANRELPYTDNMMLYARAVIDREFDLPTTLGFQGESHFDPPDLWSVFRERPGGDLDE